MKPRMMPGQEPYSEEELKQLCELINQASEANVYEEEEAAVLLYHHLKTRR